MTSVVSSHPPLETEAALARLARGESDGIEVLKRYDTWPRRWQVRLTAIALGGPADVRRTVQDALDTRGNAHRAVVITALGSSRPLVRLAAAHWLTRVPSRSAVRALERALVAERDDNAAVAMLDALLAVGRPLERYLGLRTLADRAHALVDAGMPDELAWIDWSSAPRVRWATGQRVDPTVLQWLVVVACKAGTAEPNARIVAHARLLDPDDATELGLWLLRGWIDTDLVPIAQTEAIHRARDEAAARVGHEDGSVEQLTAAVLPRHLRTPAGSALASKGVLGLVAATGRAGVAPTVAAYLSSWYAERPAQSTALVAMLGWVDDPSATELLLAAHSRFRSVEVQHEAHRAVSHLAERLEWTTEDLLARTVPTAGTDEQGVLELSYGDRVFVATLDASLAFVLHDPDGRRIRSLPTPVITDDVVKATEARRLLVEVRRELRATVSEQEARLSQAAAQGTTWSGEDWLRLVVAHPVLVRLASRRLWTVRTATSVQEVQVALDGSVLDIDDAPVDIPAEATVWLTPN
ncbi:MAG: DUF4132 domain-containing protein [Micrococcales bacterium]|nr:DUF4132 domain-containing protein [Micrococcales bacterium]MCL2666159.1 DUF4132 domain-containing protein [Micrococcales bacterium]